MFLRILRANVLLQTIQNIISLMVNRGIVGLKCFAEQRGSAYNCLSRGLETFDQSNKRYRNIYIPYAFSFSCNLFVSNDIIFCFSIRIRTIMKIKRKSGSSSRISAKFLEEGSNVANPLLVGEGDCQRLGG